MSVTLLIISSVPMSAMAAMCDITVQTSSHDDMAVNMEQGMVHEETHVQHEHSMALNSDWQRDRIECGCGCHNSIDSLPHLFSPHMTSDAIQMTEHLSEVIPVRFETAWLVYAVRVPLPPPQS
jgi:hypothetical protein